MSLSILGLSGSLRRDSLNTALLRAAGELLPADAVLTVHDLGDVPLYNADLPRPESVDRLLAAIASADALLLASPEYNHSVTAVLKNALDWASRNTNGTVVLKGKPTAVLSASPGAIGGARGQQHLKLILLASQVPVFPGAEVLVGAADKKIVDGRLIDASTTTFLTGWLDGFARWVRAYPKG